MRSALWMNCDNHGDDAQVSQTAILDVAGQSTSLVDIWEISPYGYIQTNRPISADQAVAIKCSDAAGRVQLPDETIASVLSRA